MIDETQETQETQVPDSELPTPPQRPQVLNLGLTLQSVRAEFVRRLLQLQDEMEERLNDVEARLNQRERRTMSVEAMLSRAADALSMQGAIIERLDEKTEAVLEMLRAKTPP